MQVATIDYDEFVGRIAVGRILRGDVTKGENLVCLDYDGQARRVKVSRLIGFSGLQQVEIQKAAAGDIVGIAGFTDALPGRRSAPLPRPKLCRRSRLTNPPMDLRHTDAVCWTESTSPPESWESVFIKSCSRMCL